MNTGKIYIRYRLLTRLLISHILLASLPIIVTGFILVHTAQQSIEAIIKHRNLEFAKKASQTISGTLEQAERILKFNAENVINLMANRLEREVAVSNLTNEFQIFQEMYILNLKGGIEFSTRYVQDSTRFVRQAFFQQLMHGEPYVSNVYIAVDMLPFIDIATPIKRYGEITGFLFAEVNLKAMWDVMDSLVVGKRGEGFMIDDHGNYIAHSQRKRVYLNEKLSNQDIIEQILAGRMGHKIYRNEDGVPVIASYAPIPWKNWGVVIQQPIDEAFAQAHTMRLQIIILVITSIIAAGLMAYYFFSVRIVRPVNELISGIEKFSAGELRYRIPIIGHDELSALAVQFNIMAMKLARIQKKLKRTERFETLNKMASILSHEIKNPLNAMVINLQIMKKELQKVRPDMNRAMTYYDIVSSEISRVDKLVNDFLMLARSPKLEENRQVLQTILHDVMHGQKADADSRHITMESVMPDETVYIRGNPDRLKQAFLNIYLNAIQAIGENGTIRTNVEVVANDPHNDSPIVSVTIEDTGTGIDERSLMQIFDFYFTTKENGSGLGLAITQQIIEEHDGMIQVHSEIGKGTTFIITLPLD